MRRRRAEPGASRGSIRTDLWPKPTLSAQVIVGGKGNYLRQKVAALPYPGVASRLGLEARGPMSRPLDHLAEGNRAAHARWGGLVIAVLRPLTLESAPEGVGHDELA